MKSVLICDKKWYESYKDREKINFDDIILYNKKDPNFSNLILTEIENRDEDNIILIGDGYNENISILYQMIDNLYSNNINVYSSNLKNYDFTSMNRDTVVVFNSKPFNRKITERSFSIILSLQKYLISRLVNSKKYDVNIYNKNGIKYNIVTDEDKLLNNRRVRGQRYKKLPKVNSNTPFKTTMPKYKVKLKNEKPKILFVSDVKGWAWWNKTEFLKKYLSEYYDIDLISVVDGRSPSIDYNKYDLYFTYGYSYVNRITRAPIERRISGITAHRPLDALRSRLSKVAWTHSNSVLLYKDLQKIHSNCFYVPNGVDSNKFTPNKLMNNGKMTFGHVGKKSPRKGQEEFIEPAIHKANVPYFSHYNNYKNKIKHSEMPKIYKKFDVFICASYEDGTPCPALEAASSGIPIISNKIGNMPELVETYKTGILLDTRNIDDYVDAIKWCQSNPDKVIEMGKNIRERIENEWTWELMSKNYLKMFDTILNIERDKSIYENPALYHIKE